MSRNRIFGVTARVMMSVAAGLLALSYLAIVLNPAKVWVITIFGLLFIPFALLNFILLIWALKRRSRSFVIPLLILLPCLFFVGRYVQLFGEGNPPEDGEKTIKVVSWNVGRFARFGYGDADRKACRDSVVAFLKGEDADVICLQEFRADDLAFIKPYLSRTFKGYGYAYYLYTRRRGCYGNVTLSRLPIRDKGKIIFENSTNIAIYTDLQTEEGTLRIYNCHFESYNISLTALAQSLADRNRDVLRETEVKMKRSIVRRPKQVEQVFEHIGNSPLEAVVCGDFNDSPMSYTYFKMSRGREDSFVEAGRGFGATYSELWPFLRIDYVLYPERFEAVGHETPRIGFSDHYPVVTEIGLRQAE